MEKSTQRLLNDPSEVDLRLRRRVDGRLLGLRVNRYSWWTHARELADYILPRRYKWLVTPNQMGRGSPINQHILDSTGTLAARNLAAGIFAGVCPPTKPWFNLKVGHIDSTQTSPVSLWLAECERLMRLVLQESNFYTSAAVWIFDLVVFGTAVMLIYEDYNDVVNFFNPCFGEYYVDIDGQYRPCIFYREFTYTVAQTVERFGYENCSPSVQQLYDLVDGSGLTRELIIAHAIEPNEEAEKFGIPKRFKYREVYWQYGGSQSTQQSGVDARGFLEKKGYFERMAAIVRWDLVSNDPYGRSPAMDALPDVKQLQQEVRRKAQAIDKHVNPPMLADMQLKNQPASLLPGGVTYLAGMSAGNKVGFAPVYTVQPELAAMTEDLNEVRERIRRIFFNDLFQTASQYETRSNVTAVEWDMRKSESLIMLGPVLGRLNQEGLAVVIDRVFNVMARAGIFPEPPAEIAGKNIDIEYISMLTTAQESAAAAGIERLLGMVGNLGGIDPQALDNVDIDFALDKLSSLLNNDPRLIRSPEQLMQIRQQRQQQMEQQQRAAQAEQLAKSAKVLSETQVGGSQNALQMMTNGPT